MKHWFRTILILFLAFTLTGGPGMVSLVFAQDSPASAPDDQVQTLRQLAKAGYLGDQKDLYLSANTLTDDQVTDALLKISGLLSQADVKSLHPGSGTYQVDDLKALLSLVQDKTDDIVARKASAWKFKTQIRKMIAALAPPPAPTPTATAAPQPTPTATPIPGPSRAEWDEMKGTVKDLAKKTDDMRATYDQKVLDMQKSNDEARSSNADAQEQLRLVKKLLDEVQDNLNKTGARLDDVAQKASQKSITDTELQQELTIMHKDLRDNSQDVGILKEEVAKLSKEDEKDGQSPLDQILSSKWVSGGALVVGLTALVVALTKK